MDLTLSALLEIFSRGSVTTAAILIIWALMTERLVPKRRLDDCIKQRERLIKQRDRMMGQDNTAKEISPYHGD